MTRLKVRVAKSNILIYICLLFFLFSSLFINNDFLTRMVLNLYNYMYAEAF
jgi:hypothetical protein